jgi:hypothetical protein
MRSRVASLLLFCLIAPPSTLAAPKVHTVFLGSGKNVPYSVTGDPAGALPGEKQLRVRPLLVDGKVKEWTSGESHAITDRSFVVRRVLRLNDSLPADKTEHWIWQRGPWLMVDRLQHHSTASAGLRSCCFECDLVSRLCGLLWINRKRQAVICCGCSDCRSQAGAGEKNIAMVPRREPLARVRSCTVAAGAAARHLPTVRRDASQLRPGWVVRCAG